MIPNQETIDKIRQLERYILEVPERYSLDFFGGFVKKELTDDFDDVIEDFMDGTITEYFKRHRPPCGAAGCLAGNICVMAGLISPAECLNGVDIYEFEGDTAELARVWLGISEEDSQKLFYLASWGRTQGNGWPEHLEEELLELEPGTLEYAQKSVERLELYVHEGI